MRIGIVTYDYQPSIGGLGIVARQTREALSKLHPSDHTVVISPSSGADERVSSIAAFFWKKRGGCPMFSLMIFFRLSALIRKHSLDLLHVHAGSGGVFLLRKPSCPLVVTSHHTYLQEAELVFVRQPIKRLWKQFMSLLEHRTYEVADKIVCVSQDTADYVKTRYQQPASKLIVIENALELPKALKTVQKELMTILFVGRLEERKGIWTLLRAMKIIRESYPEARLTLVGNNLIGSALHTFLRSEHLTDVVTLSGHLDDAAMQTELSRATVLVVPSLLEGFGLIAAQGMLAGTTVIASDAPGLRSVIVDKKTGLLFRVGDSDDCARIVGLALSQPELRHRLEEAAKAEALQRFDVSARAEDLHDIFTDLFQ